MFKRFTGKNRVPVVVLALYFCFHLSNFAASSTPHGLPPAKDRIVVMISVDGLAAHYLDDPKAEMPAIRALAAQGARAASMKPVNPTVTWPNHTTLVTGVNPARHGVVGNNYLDRQTGKRVVLISDPVYDKVEIVKTPTIYDLAKQAGLKTASVLWPASRNAPTLDWTTPDVVLDELFEKCTTPELLRECDEAGITSERDRNPAKGKKHEPSDDQNTRMFNLILKKHHPNLGLLHLIIVDHTQHLNGPNSEAAYAAIKDADQHVQAVWETLQKEYPGRATLFIVSDHGFSAIHKIVLPNVILRQAGLGAERGQKNPPVQVVVQGGSAMIYILDQARRDEIAAKVKQAFSGVKGVRRVIGPNELNKYGVARPEQDPHAPDMMVFVEEGLALGDTASGDLPFEEKPERKGSHGHDASIPDLHATFVAWGAGIQPGLRLREISNLSVAPTLAELIGVRIPNCEGKPLKIFGK